MSPLSFGSPDQLLVGNAAGWHLSFHRAAAEGDALFPSEEAELEIGNDEYYAEIRASLPEGLAGGVYSFVVEGLTDQHYGKIARKEGAPDFVRLYLYWLDTDATSGGYLRSLAGLTDAASAVTRKEIKGALVAVLKILSVSRKAGSRRYETTITAQEWVFDRLSGGRLSGEPILKDTPEAALTELLKTWAQLRDKKDFEFRGRTPNPACPPAPPASGALPQVELKAGRTLLGHLRQIAERLEEETGSYGRGMFLIRDGCLHVGTRPIPLDEGKEPKKLTLGVGLIEVESLSLVATDPNFSSDKPSNKPPQRRQFKLTLKGRPDLKPGDVVQFLTAPEDEEGAMEKTGSGPLGALGNLLSGPILPSLGDADFSKAVKLYVASVEHRLGRTSGFVTTVTGVEIKDPAAAWDCHTPAGRASEGPGETSTGPETEAARAVSGIARGAVEARSFPEVGEVRQARSSGASEPPGHTLKVWRGTQPGDARAYSARRAPIRRPSAAPAEAVPYATPFAWGKCGLVLPRYPGTRVVLVHRDGSSDDPIDVGALWESGKGPHSQPGDWWLILPVEVPSSQREQLGDSDTPQEHTGKVTQDLIDADGNRVIEVGELTLRIGKNDLKNAGERPTRGEPEGVTIEHVGGQAKIVIDKNGKVTVTAKEIVFDAGSGTISMKANKVDVTVTDAMDVHG